MNISIQKFEFDNTELFCVASSIRNIVFVQEQGVDINIELDGNDNNATHYLLYVEKIPVATARWREYNKCIKLERFAVLKSYRSYGVGGRLLSEIIADVKTMQKEIFLNAQKSAVNFYLKNGFELCGEMFLEADIEHYKMTYVPG